LRTEEISNIEVCALGEIVEVLERCKEKFDFSNILPD